MRELGRELGVGVECVWECVTEFYPIKRFYTLVNFACRRRFWEGSPESRYPRNICRIRCLILRPGTARCQFVTPKCHSPVWHSNLFAPAASCPALVGAVGGVSETLEEPVGEVA